MSIDAELDFEEELDDEFLQFYRSPRATLSDSSPVLRDEEDEEDELSLEESLLLSQAIKLNNLIIERRVMQTVLRAEEPAVEENVTPVKATDDSTIREAKRNYQKRYRLGEIPPAKAKEFQRKRDVNTESGRRKLTYYLSPSTVVILKDHLKAASTSRRDLVIKAVSTMLQACYREGSQALPPVPHPEVPFPRREFFFDEIPSALWDDIDRLCRQDGGKRKIRLYQFVEAALLSYLC